MGKFLFWIVIIIGALLLARLAARQAARRHATPPPRDARGKGRELLVRCAHCGIQLPSHEAVRRQGFNYCGLPHSLRGPREDRGPSA